VKPRVRANRTTGVSEVEHRRASSLIVFSRTICGLLTIASASRLMDGGYDSRLAWIEVWMLTP